MCRRYGFVARANVQSRGAVTCTAKAVDSTWSQATFFISQLTVWLQHVLASNFVQQFCQVFLSSNFVQSVGWAGWLAGWAGQLAGWQGWLAVLWLAGWLAGWAGSVLAGRASWLAGWLD